MAETIEITFWQSNPIQINFWTIFRIVYVVDDLENRDLIPNASRYEWMIVYVKSAVDGEPLTYQLRWGISNDDWVVLIAWWAAVRWWIWGTLSNQWDLQNALDAKISYLVWQNINGNWFDINNLWNITFKTWATGWTLRTWTSNADKYQIQAYDVNDSIYRTLLEADAWNEVKLQLMADYLHIQDATDNTKKLHIDLSWATTSTYTSILANQTQNRTLALPDESWTLATRAYAESLFASNDAMLFKWVIDCSTNPNYPAWDAWHTYKISVAGKIWWASGINVEVWDTVICAVNGTASGDQATVWANRFVVQANLDWAVIWPASSTDSFIALFDGTTGKLLKVWPAIPASAILWASDTQTVTNKDIDATQNTISNVKDFISWIIEIPEDWEYKLCVNIPYWFVINKTTTICDSWSAVATFSINWTNLWGSANAVTVLEDEKTHNSNNIASSWQDIEVTISSNSSCQRMSFNIEFTRTL